jgi:hypothetical protein
VITEMAFTGVNRARAMAFLAGMRLLGDRAQVSEAMSASRGLFSGDHDASAAFQDPQGTQAS